MKVSQPLQIINLTEGVMKTPGLKYYAWPMEYGLLHIIIILYNNAQYNNIRAYSLITPDYYIFWLVIDYIVALYLNTKGILRLYWQKLIQA